MIPSSKFEKLIGGGLVLGAILYLIPFVTRGWVSHDEGLLGQVAERVMSGGLPHVDFEDPYSGGLSWIYASLLRITGVELAHIRWLLFAGAALAAVTLYDLCRRIFGPIGAGVATCLGIVWAFPNYFAGLPSWWLLICGLMALWAMLRHQETGRLRYLVAASLAAGIAVAIKQTGVYLCVALLSAALFDSAPLSSSRSVDRALRVIAAAGTLIFALLILRRGLATAETIYLFLPITACAVSLALSGGDPRGPRLLRRGLVMSGCAAVPVLMLLTPYIRTGHVSDFLYGVLVQPQARFAFASLPMPAGRLIVLGMPIVALLLPLPFWRIAARPLTIALWIVSIGAAFLATRSQVTYQLLWQSTRAAAALLPIAICWRLQAVTDIPQRRRLFLAACVLAWMALNQFPFGAPAYFCYVAPVALFAALCLGGGDRDSVPGMLPWGIALTLFAVVSLNTGYLDALGWKHQPLIMNSPLALPRAHLLLPPSTAATYQTLVATVDAHAGNGRIVAVPDCPEVYFLTGRFNRSGKMYDFFKETGGSELASLEQEQWKTAALFVINHQPGFSSPLSEAVLVAIRAEFDQALITGPFEIRWRRRAVPVGG